MQLSLRDQKASDLKLDVKSNSLGKTIIAHQYQTHPLKISRPFYLDPSSHYAYLYLRNNSPGLFAKDKLNISINLHQDTQVYLTEQSATKVHPMTPGSKAEVNYKLHLQPKATLELVSEPIIFYRDSALKQTTQITMHPTASLFWSEIILPGRLARGESYQFRDYQNCLEVVSHEGKLWLKEQTFLLGKNNPFRNFNLFTSLPVLGTAIAIMPHVDLNLLVKTINNLNSQNAAGLTVATSVLPYDKGLLFKVIASQAQLIKKYYRSVINALRQLNNQPLLPNIPK